MAHLKKNKKKATKENEKCPSILIFHNDTKQILYDIIKNSKLHISPQQKQTKKNKTEKKEKNKYCPCSQIDLLFSEQSSQSNSYISNESSNTNNIDDSDNTHDSDDSLCSHNLNKKKKAKEFETIVTQITKSISNLSNTLSNISKEKEQKQNTNDNQAKQETHSDQINNVNFDTTKKKINTSLHNNIYKYNPNSQNYWYETNFPPLQQVHTEKNQKQICVSQEYIINNAHLYGNIDIKKNTDYILITLYPHDVALTLQEINQIKYTEPEKTMYRCPLPSCQHKPLNQYYLQKHLEQHCQQYHHNDNIKYHFQFLLNGTYQNLYYPPKSTKQNTITFQSPTNFEKQHLLEKKDKIWSHNKDKNHPTTLEKKLSTEITDSLLQSPAFQFQIFNNNNADIPTTPNQETNQDQTK